METPIFDVTSAVAVLNQTLEFSYPSITVVGELSQFQVSKGKWLYFDIKDNSSKLKCFGTVWQMKTALENGMQIEVVAQPRLHNLYGFSLNILSVRPVGEGSIKKAADLLRQKLEREGLFAPDRKRLLPYPPSHIALIASVESAAYADFMKILQARWPYMQVDHYEVSVQGALAEEEVVRAVALANQQPVQPEVLVLIRGGGSADDLAAFSTETVTRAVASSRVPTIVAIGHEVDMSLAELAADVRASTPSNAAELLVPDKVDILRTIKTSETFLSRVVAEEIKQRQTALHHARDALNDSVANYIKSTRSMLDHALLRLESYHPKQVLKRGYGLIRVRGNLYKSGQKIAVGDQIEVELEKAIIDTKALRVREKNNE
jgi:exodeoxyribonuclease VII large subunit